MEGKTCWCCGEALQGFGSIYDGICARCGLEDRPRWELTPAGKIVIACFQVADSLIAEDPLEAMLDPREPICVW